MASGYGSDLRRSLMHLFLRWQARLEGSGPDRIIPWVLSIALFVLFGALSLARYRSLALGEEFSAWLQGVWLLTEGDTPTVSITGRSIFEGQFSIIIFPIAQLARFLPAAPLLLLLQSAALAFGVVPLWRIARSVLELGVETALVLAVAYGLQPELHNLNLSEFHPEALAVPAFLWAYLFSQHERWLPFAFAILFALSTRSDLGLVVIGLGGLLSLEGKNQAGRITALTGAFWAVSASLIFQADLAGGEFVHSDAFARYGEGPVGILWGMLGSPVEVLQDFFAQENFEKLVILFAPWMFLPILKPRFQLPLVLFGAFVFIAEIPPGEFGTPQQDVAALAFLPIATAYALQSVGRRSVRRVFVNIRVLGGVLVAAAAFFLLISGSSLYNSPWEWGSRSEADLDLIEAIDAVRDDESVVAVERALPMLAERPDVIAFPVDALRHRSGDATFDGDVLIIDESDERWTTLNRTTFDQAIGANGYDLSRRFGSISLYRATTP